jgi:hypothetical protein
LWLAIPKGNLLLALRSADFQVDFQVCCIAGFQTREPPAIFTRSVFERAADLEIGDTAGWETCATEAPAHKRLGLRNSLD